MDYLQSVYENLSPWFFDHGIKVLIIIAIAYVLWHSSVSLIERLIRKMIVANNSQSKEAEKKREDTLIRIFATSSTIMIWLVASLMILEEFGVAIAPLIAAAGVAGLALGFGGQYLIRDLISGLFIIMENQYRIGDVVCFGKTCGLVEDITLRMTTLRDLEGTVHHVPHGEVTLVSNLTKSFSRVNINIGVAYDTNLEKLIEIVNKVGIELSKDKEWKDKIIDAPQFLRVDDFADSAMIIKILGETKPIEQWGVAGEMRKRLKIAFDKNGIEIPFPQVVVHQANNKKK